MRASFQRTCLAAAVILLASAATRGQDPKQTDKNTITVELAEPARVQKFSRPVTFFLEDVIDRSGLPQPMLVYRPRGGIFVDREPAKIVQEKLGASLKAAGLLASDAASANYVLTAYVFNFGLAPGSGFEFFGKVELNVVVKDVATGKTTEVPALGTSLEQPAMLKKNIQKNVKANLEEALGAALRNFLRGNKLREVVETPPGAPAPPPSSL